MPDTIDRKLTWIFRCRYPWLYEMAPDDFRQCVALGLIVGNGQQRAVGVALESLANYIGWRRVKDGGQRRWVRELTYLLRGKRPGAPTGNTNRAGKPAWNKGKTQRVPPQSDGLSAPGIDGLQVHPLSAVAAPDEQARA